MKTHTIHHLKYMVSLGRIYRDNVEIGTLHDCSDAPGSGSPYSANFKVNDASYRLYGDTIEGLLEEIEEFRAARIVPPPRRGQQFTQAKSSNENARITELNAEIARLKTEKGHSADRAHIAEAKLARANTLLEAVIAVTKSSKQ